MTASEDGLVKIVVALLLRLGRRCDLTYDELAATEDRTLEIETDETAGIMRLSLRETVQ